MDFKDKIMGIGVQIAEIARFQCKLMPISSSPPPAGWLIVVFVAAGHGIILHYPNPGCYNGVAVNVCAIGVVIATVTRSRPLVGAVNSGGPIVVLVLLGVCSG